MLSAQNHHPCMRPSPNGGVNANTWTFLYYLILLTIMLPQVKGNQYLLILHALCLL